MHTCPEASLVEVKSLPFTPDPGQIMQLQSKWKPPTNLMFQFLCPMLSSKLVLGKEEDSGDESCAPSILPGTLQSLFSPPPSSLSPREEALGPGG